MRKKYPEWSMAGWKDRKYKTESKRPEEAVRKFNRMRQKRYIKG